MYFGIVLDISQILDEIVFEPLYRGYIESRHYLFEIEKGDREYLDIVHVVHLE
jgi:hypothetical protein